jgi:hypothetical protein
MYFDNCNNLDELKKAYKRLALKNHPDMGGDVETMKAINAEYDRMFNILKNENSSTRKDATTTETAADFKEIIEKLIKIPEIEVELCGSWLWITGNTKPVKEQLKEAGCKWAHKKQKWFWRADNKKCGWSKGSQSMETIRAKYGSETVLKTGRRVALAGA